jgi:hypothetical protein
VAACALLSVANACSGSSFSASPNESGGSDAGEAAVAGQGDSAGTLNRGGRGAGGSSGLGGGTSDHAGSVSESGAGEPSEAGSGGLGGAEPGNGDSAGSAGDCTVVAWFPDTDGDGFGRASGQVMSCAPPAKTAWAIKAGDCDDDNKAVFPKEIDFEASGYTATSNGISFDYDCSNQEESDPSQLGAAPACNIILNCTGSGFANTDRSGPGVNPLCGSKSLVTCTKMGLSCVAVTSVVPDGVRCH